MGNLGWSVRSNVLNHSHGHNVGTNGKMSRFIPFSSVCVGE